MSIKSIVKINEGVGVETKPKGWIVREIYDAETNRSKVFEFGIFIDDNTFLGIPLHYSFKKDLISRGGDDTYKYYLMDDNTEVGLSTFRNKKGKLFPVLVKPSEKHPAIKVAAIALAPEVYEKVIHSEITREDNIVLRDYIDKDRKCIAVIVACNDTGVINPSISLNITTGAINSKLLTTKSFDITSTVNATNMTSTTDSPVKTQFIKFNRFIKQSKTNETADSEQK